MLMNAVSWSMGGQCFPFVLKWLRSLVLFDVGTFAEHPEMNAAHFFYDRGKFCCFVA